MEDIKRYGIKTQPSDYIIRTILMMVCSGLENYRIYDSWRGVSFIQDYSR